MPIFHCNAILLALGPRVGLDPQRHNFALGIPTCWYLKTLIFVLPRMRTLKFANLECEQVEYRSPMQSSRVCLVDFKLFVSLSFALGSQHEHNFQWNMGFIVLPYFLPLFVFSTFLVISLHCCLQFISLIPVKFYIM